MATTTVPAPTLAPGIVNDDALFELIDGQRVEKTPMGVFAVWLASELLYHLRHAVNGSNVGRVVSEALFHMPDPCNRDRRPDVAFVSYARWPKDRPIPVRDNAWKVVPNLAVEVVSPTDAAEDLEAKIAEYFRAGVEQVWLVYAIQSKIHVYHSPTRIDVVTANDILDGGTIVPGFRLPLAQLFVQATDVNE